ncbi:MAG TPA: hypothetical protein VKH35_13805 [Thermoanaerobaculia bacterium]|nr:hypothetical protein [Thermoanaerobaculia bacterium]
MKHGQKAKAKAAKAKAPKKSHQKVIAKSKSSPTVRAAKAGGKGPSRTPVPAAKGRSEGRAAEAVAFNNPIVAGAFKHAVKKYPTAFRRLTD